MNTESRGFGVKHLIAFAGALLTVGFIGTHLVQKTVFDPNKPEVQARRFNASIESNLCLLIEEDLDRFKKSPLNFARSDLETLIAEATQIARMSNTTAGSNATYTGLKTDYLKGCVGKAKQWLKISTLASTQLDTDYEYLPSEERAVTAKNPNNTGKHKSNGNAPQGVLINARALVVGNAEYRDRPLRNPVNDATAMASQLKDLGFEVSVLLNASSIELKNATERFLREIPKYKVNLLFYSGHGVEIAGRNYLIPSDAEIRRIGEFARQATDLTKLVTDAERYPDVVSIFIVDACRTLPVISETRGVSTGMSEIALKNASGVVVAYSTSPGSLALDGNESLSPYTSALVKQLQSRNRDVETLLKNVTKEVRLVTNGRQIPWYSSSLVGQVSLDTKQSGDRTNVSK